MMVFIGIIGEQTTINMCWHASSATVVLSIFSLVCHVLQLSQLLVVLVIVLVYSNVFEALIINFKGVSDVFLVAEAKLFAETETRKKRNFLDKKEICQKNTFYQLKRSRPFTQAK